MRLVTLQAIVHTEFVPPGQTVNQVFFYKDILERLRKKVIRVRPDIARQIDDPSRQRPMSLCPLHHRFFFYLKGHSCGSPAPPPPLFS